MATGSYTLQQVTHLEGGIETFAFKPEGVIDPLAEDLIWLEEGDPIPEGYEEYTMSVSSSGTRGKTGQGPFETCYICRYDYPVSKMLVKNGRYYCIPQKCYEEML